MKIIESLEREGGHVVVLAVVMLYALLILSLTSNVTVAAVCHDIVVGGFSALLAILRGGPKSPGEKSTETTATEPK